MENLKIQLKTAFHFKESKKGNTLIRFNPAFKPLADNVKRSHLSLSGRFKAYLYGMSGNNSIEKALIEKMKSDKEIKSVLFNAFKETCENLTNLKLAEKQKNKPELKKVALSNTDFSNSFSIVVNALMSKLADELLAKANA